MTTSGLVDPHFEGPIGSIVINFSKNDVLLSEGEEFFRVIFLKHDRIAPDNSLDKTTFDHEAYTTAQLERLVSGFPETFLQAGEMEKRIRESVMEDEVIEGLENALIDKMAARLLRKHIGKLLGAAVLFGAGLLLLFKLLMPEYTDEEIKNIAIEGVKSLLPASGGG